MKLGLVHVPAAPSRHLAAMLAPPLVVPDAVNWQALIPFDGDALGNDEHANCVECAALRTLQIQRAAVAGDTRKPTAAEALALYTDWAGWPQTGDSGTRSDVAAAKWASNGIAWGPWYEDVPAIAPLDVTNTAHLRAAIAFLGPIELDLALPVAWQNAPLVWDVTDGADGVPGSWGAHRVCAGRYDTRNIGVVTWGQERLIPWSAVLRYGLGAYAVASRSWLSVRDASPLNDLDFEELEAELRTVSA